MTPLAFNPAVSSRVRSARFGHTAPPNHPDGFKATVNRYIDERVITGKKAIGALVVAEVLSQMSFGTALNMLQKLFIGG